MGAKFPTIPQVVSVRAAPGLGEKPLGARDGLQNEVLWKPVSCVLSIKQRDDPDSDSTFYIFIFGLLHV